MDSSVDTATVYGLDGRVSVPVGATDFYRLHNVQAGSEAHPAFYPMDTGGKGSFPAVKRPGHAADHSPSI
jgi:hypothetical protein